MTTEIGTHRCTLIVSETMIGMHFLQYYWNNNKCLSSSFLIGLAPGRLGIIRGQLAALERWRPVGRAGVPTVVELSDHARYPFVPLLSRCRWLSYYFHMKDGQQRVRALSRWRSH